MFISKKELHCLSGEAAQLFFKNASLQGLFVFYNNFIVQHSFINQGLLADLRPYW